MAQSLYHLPSEQALVECRAIVFSHDINRWVEVGEPNVYSRIQLICIRSPGSIALYKVLARLESTGTVTINIPLSERVTYHVSEPSWHQIRIDLQGLYYGLRISPDTDGNNFAVIIQHTLRSLQGTQDQPTWPKPPDTFTTGALPTAAVTAGVFRTPDPAPQVDRGRAQARRDFESQIDGLCATLSDAIKSGRQDQSAEIARKMATQNLHLSIKLKNPTMVTMDSGGNTINIRVVVEDKESSGGTFSMKVSPTTPIEKLQQEVFDRYGFPVQVQKWIVGKKIPKPGETLQDLGVRQSGATVFLYLLSGKTVGLRRSDVEQFGRGDALPANAPSSVGSTVSHTGVSTTAATTFASEQQMRHAVSVPNLSAQTEAHVLAAPVRTEQLPHLNPSPPQSLPNQRENSVPGALPIRPGMNISDLRNVIARQSGGQRDGSNNSPNPPPQEAIVNNLIEPVEQQVQDDGRRQGWTCPLCTFVNVPTRPGCEMCSTERPADYQVPAGATVDDRERSRIEAEAREEALFQQAEQARQREEELAREENLAALLQTAQQTLIPNLEEFDCGICFVPVEPGEGVVLRECLHRFCRACLSEHIRHATDPEVQCPHQDENYACHATITGQEIQALLSEEDFNRFLNRSLATAESQAANSFHCKTPNCQGWCLYEDNVNTFHCPVCNQPNCLTCKAIHLNMNCKEYQDDLKRRAQNDEAARKTQEFLENMVAGGDAMHCPMCKIILVKKDGCDWMKCSMCRTEICWATRGPRWGPGGSGDITGGCKCRVGGKKCHPRCRNCH